MLLEGLISLVVTLIKAILSIFPSLPPFPAEGLTAINSYVSLIITNAGDVYKRQRLRRLFDYCEK